MLCFQSFPQKILISFKNFFEIILNLHDSYKDNTEFLYTLDPVFSHVSILHNHRTLIKTKKLTLVDYFEPKCRISLELPRFCMNAIFFFFFSVSESHPGFHIIFHCHVLTHFLCVCVCVCMCVFKLFLTFWLHKKFIQSYLVFSLPQLETQPLLQRILVSFTGEWFLETRILGLGFLDITGMSLLLCSPRGKSQEIYVCI